jgi:hypothetical protein
MMAFTPTPSGSTSSPRPSRVPSSRPSISAIASS